ncbi:LPS export ABC transporter periplasmic protein LptC [Alteromonas sp. 5E99-2]|uniref:LPS export ABC transporter periplasmic protein LptC n=1 Tax=Alteromonas sp. 5E99-2 TaxID=2817683 RepID=UPI001A98BFA8|nr:LPS export ABC transporter periplasmic protein LptC [Alteromonas sp. 5E99-2]MBO1254296.1 LPS export ABC transporter periplasmic protein LptC [Alteromonas sp. 5E99-2]
MNRLGLSIGTLFLAALLLYLPVWLEEEEEQQASPNIDALVATYQAKNLTTKLYDENGNLSHQVFAQGMQHFDLLGFVVFEQPEYTLYPDGGTASWKLTASEGTLYNSDLLQLESDVRILSLQPDEFIKSVQTEFIEVKLNEKTVNSDQAVTLLGDHYTIIGNGFSADLEQKYYELQNHVQTVYSRSDN